MITAFTAVAQVSLSVVLVLSGLAKAIDWHATTATAIQLGIPRVIAPVIGTIVPTVELVLAIGLVVPRTAKVAGLGVTVLMLTFAVVVAVNLLEGRRPVCGCFGRWIRRQLTWTLFATDLLLAVLGIVVALNEPANPWIFFGFIMRCGRAIHTIILALLLVQFILLVELMRAHGRLLLRIKNWEKRSD
jgi:hypothetical protein